MEDGDIRKPKQLPSGPERWLGPENWKAFGSTINAVVVFGPALLFFVTVAAGANFFTENTIIQKNAVGELLMNIPRIEFDVDTFTDKGGMQHGQKCLFLWELLVLCLVPCLLADIWLFRYVTKGLDYTKLGTSDLASVMFSALFVALVVLGFFWSKGSLYKDGIGRGLPINAGMFWFPALNFLLLNMLAFYIPLDLYLDKKMKSLAKGESQTW